jgi:hypothetical protein
MLRPPQIDPRKSASFEKSAFCIEKHQATRSLIGRVVCPFGKQSGAAEPNCIRRASDIGAPAFHLHRFETGAIPRGCTHPHKEGTATQYNVMLPPRSALTCQ